jgi:hypothetical protein
MPSYLYVPLSAFALAGLLLSGCSAPQYPAQPTTQAGDASPPVSESKPAESRPVSVTIRVECAQSVDLFFGEDPKFGSGRSSRFSGNSSQSAMMSPGDMVWLTDANKNGIGSVAVSEAAREIRVTCTGISAR